MYCLKRLGGRVTAQRFDGQVAVLQVRAAILNRSSMLEPSLYGGCGVNLFGERGASACSGFVQQRRVGSREYASIVGNNPDVSVRNGSIVLVGTGGILKGKEFRTNLTASNCFK